jgi:hypothetical protein
MARRRSRLALGAVALAAWLAPRARADRYEASIALRPVGQLARIGDRGTGERATVPGGGLAGGLGWGVRNWLDGRRRARGQLLRPGRLRAGDAAGRRQPEDRHAADAVPLRL